MEEHGDGNIAIRFEDGTVVEYINKGKFEREVIDNQNKKKRIWSRIFGRKR